MMATFGEVKLRFQTSHRVGPSHGIDEHMEIDPEHLTFLYQGVDDDGYRGNKYGGIPWKLGLLELVELPKREK